MMRKYPIITQMILPIFAVSVATAISGCSAFSSAGDWLYKQGESFPVYNEDSRCESNQCLTSSGRQASNQIREAKRRPREFGGASPMPPPGFAPPGVPPQEGRMPMKGPKAPPAQGFAPPPGFPPSPAGSPPPGFEPIPGSPPSAPPPMPPAPWEKGAAAAPAAPVQAWEKPMPGPKDEDDMTPMDTIRQDLEW